MKCQSRNDFEGETEKWLTERGWWIIEKTQRGAVGERKGQGGGLCEGELSGGADR